MGLTDSSVVDASRDEVFAWHTRPGAITRLTPPWQPVTVLREAGSLRDGRAILRLPGGLRWVADGRARRYDPPGALARRAARGRRRPARRLRPAGRLRRRAHLPSPALAAHAPVQPGGGGGHAGD